jgi:hypothetical protein
VQAFFGDAHHQLDKLGLLSALKQGGAEIALDLLARQNRKNFMHFFASYTLENAIKIFQEGRKNRSWLGRRNIIIAFDLNST